MSIDPSNIQQPGKPTQPPAKPTPPGSFISEHEKNQIASKLWTPSDFESIHKLMTKYSTPNPQTAENQ